MRLPNPIPLIFDYLLAFAIFAVLPSILYFILQKKRLDKGLTTKKNIAVAYIFGIYAALLLYVTVIADVIAGHLVLLRGERYYDVNLIPFAGIAATFKHTVHGFDGIVFVLFNTLGISLMYLPLGFGLTMIGRTKTAVSVLICVAAPILIEAMQFLLIAGCDIDDVILGISGALLGVLLGLLIRRLFPKFAAAVSLREMNKV